MELKSFDKAIYFFVIFILLSFVFSSHPYIKYIKYIPSIFGGAYLFFLLLERKVYLKKEDSIAIAFFILFFSAFINFILKPGVDYLFIDVFINLMIFFSYFTIRNSKANFKIVFFIFLIGISFHFILSVINNGFDIGYIYSFLTSSSSPYENSIASYVFGAYVIYFVSKGDTKLTIFSLLGVFVCSKRVTIIALLAILILHVFSKVIDYTRSGKILAFSFLLIWICVSVFITTDNFNNITMNLFSMSSNYLTKGRVYLYNVAIQEVLDNGSFFYGLGIGSLYPVLTSSLFDSDFYFGKKVLLHNEILRLSIELGIIGFFVFFYLFFNFLRSVDLSYQAKLTRYYILMYSCIIGFMGNNFVYYNFWFFVFIILNEIKKDSVDKYNNIDVGVNRYA